MTKILLVEDNEMNRDMLSRRLTRRGYEIVMAVDGQEAYDMALSENADVILMDMGLPVLDGWEVVRRLREKPEMAATPIIALTAFAMAEDKERALSVGCDDFATKPVDLPSLLEKIEAQLGSS